MGRDIRYALRGLRSSPAFTFAAIATLALSVGAATSMFSVVSAVLLRDLPYPKPEQIAALCERDLRSDNPCNVVSPASFLGWREEASSFETMAASYERAVTLTGGDAEPVSARARLTTASLFPLLGAQVMLGRLFTEDEDRGGTGNVLVLSHAFWRQHFGGDPSIIGRTVLMNAADYTVIGVAAPGFQLFEPVDLWTPIRFTAAQRSALGRYLRVVARLRSDASIERADVEMKTMAARRALEQPVTNGSWTALAVPLRDSVVGSSKRVLWMLMGAVAVLLLIACANVANLLLARATDRQREMAVRISLGARRLRLIRQLLTESLVLSLLSSAIGFVIAATGTRALVALVPRGVASENLAAITVDWRVSLFSAVVAILTGVIFGLAPALQLRQLNLQQLVQEGGQGGRSAASSTVRLRSALVVAEVSLALVLLAGAGLMIRSFTALQRVRLGFEPSHVLTARLTLPGPRYPSDTALLAFYQGANSRLAAIPGVTAIGMISVLPLSGERSVTGFNVEGRPPAPPGQEPAGDIRAVSPEYFRAMGVAIIKGRALTDEDRRNTPEVCVVSETLARTFWPGGSAVGQTLTYELRETKRIARVAIVGVAADVHHAGLDKEAFMEIYRPITQLPSSRMTIVARVIGDPASYAGPILAAIRSIDQELPLAQVRPMTEWVAESLGTPRLSTALFGLFGALALILAAVGIYGLMSHTVEQRRHEIGIRMTLGARPGQVVRMIVERGALLALIGIVIGLVAAVALTRFMEKLLFDVPPADPVTFAIVALLLAVVSLAAAYLPSRRATRVDPLAALRGD